MSSSENKMNGCTDIRSESGEITIDLMGIKGIINLTMHTHLITEEKWDQSLKETICQNSHKRK